MSDPIENARLTHYELSSGELGDARHEQDLDLNAPVGAKHVNCQRCGTQDKLQQALAETYAHIRRSNDTAAIRRVNQGTADLLKKLGFGL